MTRKALSAVAMGLALFSALAVEAQTIPQTFTFTARVSNADGPLTGTHQIILRMYDAGTAGTKLWEESHVDVPVRDGLLTLAMGSETNITNADLTDAGVWVEVVVDGSTLAPRIQLRAVPYARRSQDTLRLGGQLPSAFVEVAGDTMTGSLGINGDLNLNGSLALRGNDSWLRLNQAGSFASGVYTPGLLRVDGDIQLSGRHAFRGSDSWLRLNQDGAFASGTHTPHNFNASGLTVGELYYDPGVGNLHVGGVQVITSANFGDCQAGWYCNLYAWDLSIASMLYSGLVQRSDRRLKKDIEPVKLGLDAITGLRPVTFLWKDGRIKGRQYGFIAQDVEKVIPELVTENNKGYKTLETLGILPVTVKAVQELKAENDKLRADVAELRDEIEAIKAGKPLPAKTGKTASRWVIPVGLGSGIALVFAFGALAAVRIRRKGPPA